MGPRAGAKQTRIGGIGSDFADLIGGGDPRAGKGLGACRAEVFYICDWRRHGAGRPPLGLQRAHIDPFGPRFHG